MRTGSVASRPACAAVVVSLALAVAASCAAPSPSPSPGPGPDVPPEAGAACADLATLELIDLRITGSDVVAAGEAPAHCRVTGVIETEITFELLLPEAWNGRFLMGGGGGFVGSVQNQAQSPMFAAAGGSALDRGYATVGTDTGHVGNAVEAGWALHDAERQENFGHRAVHLTAEAAKSIIRHYYDRMPSYSYFVGCSRGGGQGMMESQRYPADFDGVVSGAPAYDWAGFGAGFLQTQQAIYPAGAGAPPVITPENRALLARSVDTACDALDGVEDDILGDPRTCSFRLEDLPRCAGDGGGPDCVTPAQLEAMQAIYRRPIANGAPLYYGFPLGSEADAEGWEAWITGGAPQGLTNLHHGFGTELYKYFVFGDSDWDYTTYDFSTWREDTAVMAETLSATDTDLSAFENAGGKLLLWVGWSDLAQTALGTIAYYEGVEAADPAAHDYARLYLLPGVRHCGGGPGPDAVDWIDTIRAWVEEDRAPERLVASKLGADGAPTMTRPLCPYPQTAVYDGAGDPDDAASFACASPR